MIIYEDTCKRNFCVLVMTAIWAFVLNNNQPVIVNPLSPKSDQDQFSPNNIHTPSRDKLWE